MKKLALFLLAIIGMACASPETNSPGYAALEATEFITQFESDKNAILLDVRTPEEFNAGSIKGAINIDYFSKDFETKVSKLDTNKTAYVYCKSGGRSFRASKALLRKGFTSVKDLSGGYSAYLKK